MNGKYLLCTIVLVALACVTSSAAEPRAPNFVLKNSKLGDYVGRFNADDEELYANIPNEEAFDFLERNIPLFECPDPDIERTYYFRWWTYRKHVKKTTDGWVITEFLPQVPWSAKHNTISCPAGHHFYEGRWLRDGRYMNDYAVFWFRGGGSPRRYSFWAADAIYADYLVRQNRKLAVDLLDDLVANYEAWERSRLTADGLFWQIDDRDGMEVSVGGSGKRATINSYMYGGARAIAKIAAMAGRDDLKAEYEAKAARLKYLVQTKLWDDEAKFFKTLKRSDHELATPMHSGDGSVLRMHWWARERLGKPQWIQYDLPTAASVDGVEVYWHADGSGIRLPKSWRVTYREGESWTPVANTTPYEIVADRMNGVKFAAVKTDALRLEVNSYEGKVAGLYEWRVLSGDSNVAVGAKASASFPTTPGRLGDPLKALNNGEGKSTEAELVDVREEHGFTPWYFNLPEPGKGYEVAWKQLMDPEGFYAPFGPTTAEQRHPGFKVVYEGHGCQWNGPSWPYATAVTLTAMANVLNNYPQDAITREDYFKTLKVYTASHRRERSDGKVVPWIDENIDPFTGAWIARKMLLAADAERRAEGKPSNHIKERGKDYNHSSYCDLIITGLVGLRPRADDTVEVNPLVPADTWDYFCLDGVPYHGRMLTILYDKTGERYGRGCGLRILADGQQIGTSETLGRITASLPKKQMHMPQRQDSTGPQEQKDRNRPNILFCLADDQSYPHASAYREPVINTAVFDRVAREGVLFTQAYCAAPSCTPSRSAILTGQDIWRLGEGGQLFGTLSAEHPVYTDLLTENGYHVGYMDKGWAPGNVQAGGRSSNPAGPRFRGFQEFLDKVPEGEPWCFWFGSRDPHRGYRSGSGVQSGMDPTKVRVPEVFPDTPEVRSDICDYFFEIQRFDQQIGEMLKLIEQTGQLDNTLVVITSDNGMPFPRAKANLYDLGSRMPLAIRWPKQVPGGRTVDDFVNLTDLAPTFLEAAGLTPPKAMTGRSLLPLLKSTKSGVVEPGRDAIYAGRERHAWCRIDGKGYPARMIRVRDFLYVRNYEPDRWPAGTYRMVTNEGHCGDVDASPTKDFMIKRQDSNIRVFEMSFGKRPREELYDCLNDPYQLQNLASDPAHRATLRKLSDRLTAHLKATGDPRETTGESPWDAWEYYGNKNWTLLPERATDTTEELRAEDLWE